TAREFTRDDLPLGCMISLACTHVPPGLESMRKMMAELRAGAEAAFAERIRKGIADGDVPKGTDVDALASYYSALAQGLAVHARDGASREKLLEIGRIGMLAWPTAPIKTNKSRGVGSTTVLAGFGGRPTPDRPAQRKRGTSRSMRKGCHDKGILSTLPSSSAHSLVPCCSLPALFC